MRIPYSRDSHPVTGLLDCGLLDCRLGGSDSRHRKAIRGAAYIVQSYPVAESDGFLLPAVFTANACLQLGPVRFSLLNRQLDQLSDPFGVQYFKRVVGEQLLIQV
jgi:hypothetical protein